MDSLTVRWERYLHPALLLDLRWRNVGQHNWTYGLELRSNTTEHTATGLSEGSHMEFSLQALGADGEYSDSVTVQGETLAESRATNVRATEIQDRRVKVSWKPAKTGGGSQKVYVSWDGGLTWRFSTVSDDGPMLKGDAVDFVVQSLLPDSVYMFRVDTLFLGSGGIVKSTPSPIIRSLPGQPRSIDGLLSRTVTDTSIQLIWKSLTLRDEIGSSSVSYIIEVREGSAASFPDPNPFQVNNSTNLTISGLLRNTVYRVRATAVNDRALSSVASPVILVTTNGSRPQQPVEPSAQVIRSGIPGVLVTWKPLETNIATGGFEILRYLVHKKRQDEQAFDAGLDVGTSTSYFFSSNLSTNYMYEFAVSAWNALGSSPLSRASNNVLPPILPLLARPTATVSQDSRGSLITLTWVPPAPASNIMAYKVYVRQVAPASVFDSGNVVYSPTAQFAFLPDNSQFEFKVSALTGLGWSDTSAVTTAETKDDTVPTSVVAVLVPSLCKFNVTWTPPRRKPLNYRVFLIQTQTAVSSTFLVSESSRFYVVSDCNRGAIFTFAVQVKC